MIFLPGWPYPPPRQWAARESWHLLHLPVSRNFSAPSRPRHWIWHLRSQFRCIWVWGRACDTARLQTPANWIHSGWTPHKSWEWRIPLIDQEYPGGICSGFMPNNQMTERIHQAAVFLFSFRPGAFPVVNRRMGYFKIHDWVIISWFWFIRTDKKMFQRWASSWKPEMICWKIGVRVK